MILYVNNKNQPRNSFIFGQKKPNKLNTGKDLNEN